MEVRSSGNPGAGNRLSDRKAGSLRHPAMSPNAKRAARHPRDTDDTQWKKGRG